MVQKDIKSRRKEAAHRRRRIIFNNDNEERRSLNTLPQGSITPQKFLEVDMAGHVDSQVDTVFYCDMHAFDMFSHRSDVTESTYKWDRTTQELFDQGTDPLEIMVEFCRNNDIEIFWSFRINDGHDSFGAVPLPQYKKEHPEYLFGTREDVPWHGRWSGVDYAMKEVRDQAILAIEDTCGRYDVDGMEFDFFRELVCFKSLAWARGTGQECDIMTEHLRRVRATLDEIGSRKDKPLLMAVRVPDSVGFCRQLGLDIVRWMEEDLIDLLVVGGLFWLQPWQRSVELAHRYDVPVYPSLDGSRVGSWPFVLGSTDPDPDTQPECQRVRRSLEAYRAHATDAWRAGADGIYVFNLHFQCDPSDEIWRELGDAEKLATLDKIYHVSVMARGHATIDHYLPGGQGEQFLHLPTLSPDYPRELLSDQPVVTTLAVADDLPAAIDKGLTPNLKLNVQLENLPAAEALTVKLNDQVLSNTELTWESQMPETWREYAVVPQVVKKGRNVLEITLEADSDVNRPCILHDVHLRISY